VPTEGACRFTRAFVARRLRFTAAAAVGSLITSAWAATTETKGGGDWFDDSTWTNGVPIGEATVMNGDSVQVQRYGAGATVLFNNGTIKVQAADPPSVGSGVLGVGQFVIGATAQGQLVLTTGGRIASTNVVLGYTPGSFGTVNFDGLPNQSGDRATWSNNGQFFVGASGFGPATGSMTLTQQAQMSTVNVSIGAGVSTGNVSIDRSTWNNSNLFTVGDGGPLGEFSMTGNSVLNTLTGVIGYGSGGSGTLTGTSGKASIERATWNNAGDFHVGWYASGQLSVLDEGSITSKNGYVGYGIGSVGIANFSGATWSNTGELIVGVYGDGRLRINEGATVSSGVGVIGRYGLASGSVVVDNGRWTNASDLFVGHGVTGLPDTHPAGELVVRNGGVVQSVNGYIGYGPGSSGTVEVKGLNSAGQASTWAVSAGLHVGSSGSGLLTVSDGGVVSSGITYVGPFSPAAIVPGGGALHLDGTNGRRGVLGKPVRSSKARAPSRLMAGCCALPPMSETFLAM